MMTDPFLPDLCDRCNASGQGRWRLPSGLTLVFCGHHGTQHSLELKLQGGVFFPLRKLVAA